jgi:hypothetical protein
MLFQAKLCVFRGEEKCIAMQASLNQVVRYDDALPSDIKYATQKTAQFHEMINYYNLSELDVRIVESLRNMLTNSS